MAIPLNILIIEDSEDDTLLLLDALRLGGFDPKWKRVDNEADCRAHLLPHLDIVFCDFTLPRLSTPRALALLKEGKLDIPFIVVSGTIGEERAVEILKAGATDYVLKDRIKRIGQVVQRALLEAQERTDRKRAEAELRWKTALLEAQLDSALDGILVVDNQGRKILQNQRLGDFFKMPQSVVENPADAAQIQFITSRVKNCEQFAEKVLGLYSRPDEINTEEIELVDGTFLDQCSSPVRDKAGKYYGRIWTFRDITGRRKLEEQLRQSQKMEAIGQLAGGVAHDFNNILAVIQMQASMLREDLNLTPTQMDYAAEIEKSTRRAANLTRQLLLFSRKQTMMQADLDLNEVITHITKMIQRILTEDIKMEFKYAPEPLFIHADAGMMDQVLMNLTVNARDAMPQGGRLIVETSAVELHDLTMAQSPQARTGSFVCLSVSDTGCGIPREILPRIFEPFFTTKDVGKGTGLGLATVFGIIHQHHGWINLYSEVGHGTTFRIYLPRLIQSTTKHLVAPALASTRGGNETILLVEDDPSLLTSIQKTLTRLGYRVLAAPNGITALKVWQQYRAEIQLLLTDLVMPEGMNGKELAKKLLQDDPKLKVIYTSGYSAHIAGADFPLEEGVNFLTKPFETHKLAQTLRGCLDNAEF